MSLTTAMKSVIMSPKTLSLLVLLISMLCGTVISDVQPAAVSHSSNSSLPHSPSSQRSSLPVSSSEKSSDTSQSQLLVHSDATAPKVGVNKPGNPSQPDCGGKPCELSVKASGNASASSPNEAKGIVHISDDRDDLSKKLNPEALMRGFYVFVGLSIIVMAYIAWKSFGKRPTQIHRYGVVGNRDDLEMAPLDSDDGDDDDTTHFDISNHRLQT